MMSDRQNNPRYVNHGQHASDGGIINNIGRVEPLEELEDHCAFRATFVPGAHFDPPRCTEATQQHILQTVEEWIDADGNVSTIPSGIFYLHGPGAGQLSALVQSVAEKFERKNRLAASFFASQSDSRSDNGHQMIPTLVFGLVKKFEINFAQDGIRSDRRLFKKNFRHQIQKLLVEPLVALNSEGLLTVPHPQLIVIDRLDECDAQVNLFSAIAQCIPRLPYPFRFLITDRTTKRITGVLDRNPETVIREYYLGNNLDADVKIHTFLETEFKQIRRASPSLPRAWPEQKDVTSLVQRCSGDSIYASTAIEVIRSPNHGPEERLKVVLNLQSPPEGDRRYDALYALHNETLRTHLLNVEFSFPQSITAPSNAVSWVDPPQLPTIIYYPPQTFNRENSGSAGQYHNEYSGTWYRYFKFLRSEIFDFFGGVREYIQELERWLIRLQTRIFNEVFGRHLGIFFSD